MTQMVGLSGPNRTVKTPIGADAGAGHGGQCGFAVEIIEQFCLGAAAEVVEAEFVEFRGGHIGFVGGVLAFGATHKWRRRCPRRRRI